MSIHNILAIDDEVANLDALKQIFNPEYNVFSATSGEDALTVMEEKDIALILADQRMPGMTGVELMEKTWQKHPDTTRVILTGYPDEKVLMDAINMGHVYSFITKPWETQEIMETVREGVAVYERNNASRKPHIRALLHSGIISSEQLEIALKVQRDETKPIEKILLERDIISRSQLDMALELRKSKRKKLGEVLAEFGVISPDDLEMAHEQQRYEERKLVEVLLDMHYADEESILSCYATQLGIPIISLSQFPREQRLAELLPSKLAYKHYAIPIDIVGRILVVAASEPLSDEARSEIEEETGRRVMVSCASHHDVKEALRQYYDPI
jgi:YesN/AraC family two-component response regulator